MTFIWYNLLWLLLLVPLLVLLYFYIQRRKKKYAVKFSDLSLVRQAVTRGPGIRRHIPAILLLVAITVGIIALARPASRIILPSSNGTVILVMDVSKSMSADDIKPTRLDAAKNAARLFVEKQPGNVRIGIISFSDYAAVVQAPTTDHTEILESINRLSPQRGTAIGSAILLAMNTIFESSGQAPKLTTAEIFNSANPQESIASQHNEDYSYAAIVLLSDGVSNIGPTPLSSLIAAADNGVKIYTVGVGSQDGAVIKTEGITMKVLVDETTLKEIAAKTGGEYFNANSDLDLQQIYDKLGTDLVFKPQLTELTAFFTGFAILVLIVSALLSMLWFNRVF